MTEPLTDIRDELKKASDQLLDERDAAANDPAKVAVAEAEFDRIAVVLSSVQTAINQQLALNLDAVARRLEDSIEAQRAIGLSTAAATLADLVGRIRGSLASPAPGRTDTGEPAGTAGPGSRVASRGRIRRRPRSQPQGPGGSGLQAKPGKHQLVVDKLIAGATAENLEPMTVLTIVAIESEFNPTATNPMSSAGGLFQFLDATWASAGGCNLPRPWRQKQWRGGGSADRRSSQDRLQVRRQDHPGPCRPPRSTADADGDLHGASTGLHGRAENSDVGPGGVDRIRSGRRGGAQQPPERPDRCPGQGQIRHAGAQPRG